MTEQLKSKIAAIISEDRYGSVPESVIVEKIAEVVDVEQNELKDKYMYTIYDYEPVDVDAGYDTCESCSELI